MSIRRKKYYVDEDFLKQVGNKIRHYRKVKKMTLEELAFECHDVDYAHLNKIELGKVNFSISYLKLIAEKLEVPVADLLNFD